MGKKQKDMSNNNKIEEPTATYKLEPNFIYDINQLDLNKQYTYKDYMLWRFKERVELIKGWVYKMSPAPSTNHQEISGKLFLRIATYLEKKKCKIYAAPFDVRLIKNKGKNNEIVNVIQPDISIICDKTKLDIQGCIGAPDLIIEILSPSTTKKDYNEKYYLYQENRVKEYWIVNPDAKSIEVFLLDKKNKYYSKGIYSKFEGFTQVPVSIFPNLTLKLSDIFEK